LPKLPVGPASQNSAYKLASADKLNTKAGLHR